MVRLRFAKLKPKKFKNFFRHEKSPHKTYSFIRAIKAIKYSVFNKKLLGSV